MAAFRNRNVTSAGGKDCVDFRMFRNPNALVLNLIWLMLCRVPAAGAEDKILFQEDFRQPLGDRWKQIKFHDPTEYRIVNEAVEPA